MLTDTILDIVAICTGLTTIVLAWLAYFKARTVHKVVEEIKSNGTHPSD